MLKLVHSCFILNNYYFLYFYVAHAYKEEDCAASTRCANYYSSFALKELHKATIQKC